jgi:hypothetical protein
MKIIINQILIDTVQNPLSRSQSKKWQRGVHGFIFIGIMINQILMDIHKVR